MFSFFEENFTLNYHGAIVLKCETFKVLFLFGRWKNQIMLVLSVQESLKVLLNESFFANVRSLIAYFDCGTFHHFSVGFELLGEGHDGWKPWIGDCHSWKW